MAFQLIRVTVKPEHAAEVEAAVGKVFEALDEARPAGLTYASFRTAPDSYAILLGIEDGVENPLPALSAFQDFQAGLPGWLAGPPEIENLTVVGAYGI